MDFNYLIFAIIIPTLIQIYFLYKFNKLGEYPTPLPTSQNPKKEYIEAVIYTLIAILYFTIDIFILSRLNNSLGITLIFSTIMLLLIPSILAYYRDHWTSKEFGFTSKVKSKGVVILGILFYAVFGLKNTFMVEVPWYFLLILIYSNAFLEEFLFRGIIQSKLERAIGQKKAIIFQGIFFMSVHIPVNCFNFFLDGNFLRFISAFIFQLINGLIFGLIFMKTRNLWISVICHYLNNWLGATITLFL